MALPTTPEALEAIERALAECHGSIAKACHRLGFSPHHLHLWCKSDPEVAAAIQAARMMGLASLEDVAIQRAVDGTQEDVYFKGEVVGSRTNYSDGLLQTLLKARVEGFKEDAGHTSLSVNVAIMPRASTYEEWLVHRNEALQITHEKEPEDARYTAIDNDDTGSQCHTLQQQVTDEQQANTSRLRDVL